MLVTSFRATLMRKLTLDMELSGVAGAGWSLREQITMHHVYVRKKVCPILFC